MLVSELVRASLRKCGAVAAGETPDTNDQNDALLALQSMLRSWAAEKLNIYASTKESFSLIAGTASYSWGSGGTITTARPNKVIGAFVRDSSNFDHPVDIITEGKYRDISLKATAGRPNSLFYYAAYPLAYVYVYPTPDAVETMWIESFKPFTETSSFDVLGSTLAFPPEYEEPLIYNLAIRIAPEYGKALAPEVIGIAKVSYDRLVALHASRLVEPVGISIPAGSGGVAGYDIESDL